MSEWKEGIWLAVSALIIAMLINFAYALGSVAKGISHMQQNEINTTAVMEEYRQWAQYDNVILNSSDVISSIFANKSGIPAVIVNKAICFDDSCDVFDFNVKEAFITNHHWDKNNPYYLWDGSRKDTELYDDYEFDKLNEYIPPGALYKAHIKKDLNGSVIYIWFKRVPMWSNYDDVTISGEDLYDCIIESRYHDVEFRLSDDIDYYKSFSWNENSLTDDNLLALEKMIVREGTYNAVINRDFSGKKIEYIEFRRET